MVSLEALIAEYERVGIGPLLADLLTKIVRSTVRQYPASDYAPYRRWDRAACEDVLNDWIAERLWGRADLQAMLSSASTLAQLRAALTTSLRQHLTNKRRRSIAANLYKRVRGMMRHDTGFQALGPQALGADQRWTLLEQPSPDPSRLSISELVRVAKELSDDDLQVVRYGPFSQKLSPILRDPKLREFLVHLLRNAHGSLSLTTIVAVMRLRFSLPNEEHLELSDEIPSLDSDPSDEASENERARAVISRLDLEGARVLEMFFRLEGNFTQVAKSCGCSVEQVRTIVREAFGMICDASDSPEDAQATMRAVESLLLEDRD